MCAVYYYTAINSSLLVRIQLQILIDDSERLSLKYPGGNAEHIQHQLTVVIDNWHILEEKSAQRKSDLQATTDLYLFLSEASYE